MKTCYRWLALGLFAFGAAALSAQVTGTYHNGSSTLWTDPTNWSTNPLYPGAPGDTGDNATFSAGFIPDFTNNVYITSDVKIDTLTILSTSSPFSFHLTGGDFRLESMIYNYASGAAMTFSIDSGRTFYAESSANFSGLMTFINSGTIRFQGNAGWLSAGQDTFHTLSGGRVFFSDQSTGANLRLDTDAGGRVDISVDGDGNNFTVGSIAGAGQYFFGTYDVILGGNNDSTAISGDLQARSVTKIGSGTFTVGGIAAYYIGSVNVTAGTLVLAKDYTNTISFLDETFATGNVTGVAAGATLQLGGTGGNQISNTGGINQLAGTLDLNGRSEAIKVFNGSSTGLVTNSAASTTSTLTVGLLNANGGSQAFAGNIQDGAGTVALQKLGSGTLTLSGTNTYTGGTTIASGTLQVGAGGATGSIAGDIANDGALVFNRSTDLTYGGAVSGGGSLTQQGAGLLTLTGTNTYTGNTTIVAGGIHFGSSAALPDNSALSLADGGTVIFDVGGANGFTTERLDSLLTTQDFQGAVTLGLDTTNAGGSFTYSGIISDHHDSPLNLEKLGAGTLELAAANDFTGSTQILGGVLRLADSGALQNSTLAYFSSNAGTLDFGLLTEATLGGLQGDKDLALTNSDATPAGVALTIGGNGAGNTYAANLSGEGGSLIKIGGGTQVLTGTNTYTGGTVVAEGYLQFGKVSALPAVGTLDVEGGAEAVFNVGGSGEFTSTEIAPRLAGDGFQGGAFVGFDTSHGDYAYNVSIGDTVNGPLGLEKLGEGTLTLGAANTFTGDTFATGGTLALGHRLALQNSTLQYWSGAGDLSFGSLTAATLGGLNGDKDLALTNTDPTPAGVALTIGGNDASTTYSGSLSGTGASLTKEGSGWLTLSGTNTYTGGTTINGGSVQFTSLTTLPSTGALTVVAGATAAFNVGGSGEFTSTEIDALVTANSFQAGSFLGFDTSHGPRDPDFNQPLAVHYTGTLTGGLGVIVLGGILELDANTSYTGDTIVHSATLNLAGQMDATLHSANILVAPEAGDAGAFGVFDGGIARATNVILGGAAGAQAFGSIGGNGELHAANLVVGADGSGNFIVGGALVATDNVILGRDAGSTGFAGAFTASAWTNSGTLTVGDAGQGMLTISGPGTNVTSTSTVLGAQASGSGTLTLQSTGTLTTGQVTRGAGAATIKFLGGNLRATSDQANFLSGFSAGDVQLQNDGGTIDTNGHNIGIATALQGAGGLTKIGAGALTLSGANAYTGGTTISQGSLILDADQALPTGGALTLDGGVFNLNGSSQTLGTLTLTASSTIDFGSAAANTLTVADSHLLSWSGTLTILNYDSATDTLRFGTDVNGLTTAQLASINLNGIAATLDASGYLGGAAIPEPATYASLLAGLGALALIAWRKRSWWVRRLVNASGPTISHG